VIIKNAYPKKKIGQAINSVSRLKYFPANDTEFFRRNVIVLPEQTGEVIRIFIP
jgi:hypothetical protein